MNRRRHKKISGYAAKVGSRNRRRRKPASLQLKPKTRKKRIYRDAPRGQ